MKRLYVILIIVVLAGALAFAGTMESARDRQARMFIKYENRWLPYQVDSIMNLDDLCFTDCEGLSAGDLTGIKKLISSDVLKAVSIDFDKGTNTVLYDKHLGSTK